MMPCCGAAARKFLQGRHTSASMRALQHEICESRNPKPAAARTFQHVIQPQEHFLLVIHVIVLRDAVPARSPRLPLPAMHESQLECLKASSNCVETLNRWPL